MPELTAPKPALSLKAKGILGTALVVAVMLARYVGVDVPECPPAPGVVADDAGAP